MGRTNTRRQQQTHSLSVWCVCGLCTCTINERVCTCLQTVRAGSQLEAFSVSPVTSPSRTTLHETFHSRSAPGVLHLFFYDHASPYVLILNICDKLKDEEFLYVLRRKYTAWITWKSHKAENRLFL